MSHLHHLFTFTSTVKPIVCTTAKLGPQKKWPLVKAGQYSLFSLKNCNQVKKKLVRPELNDERKPGSLCRLGLRSGRACRPRCRRSDKPIRNERTKDRTLCRILCRCFCRTLCRILCRCLCQRLQVWERNFRRFRRTKELRLWERADAALMTATVASNLQVLDLKLDQL